MEETELDALIPVTVCNCAHVLVLYSDTTAPDTSLPPRDFDHAPVLLQQGGRGGQRQQMRESLG